MRYKRILKITITVVIIVLLGIAGYFIHDVNTRFPEPTEIYSYTYDNPAYERGLKIVPVSCRLYKYDEYNQIYNNDGAFNGVGKKSEWDKYTVLLFTIEYENVSDKEIIYETDNYNMVAKQSGAFNGVLLENGANKSKIQPGEKQVYTMSTIITPEFFRKKWSDKLDSDTYYLVYYWYPQIKRLEFEVEHD